MDWFKQFFYRDKHVFSSPAGFALGRIKHWMVVFSEYEPGDSSLPWYNLQWNYILVFVCIFHHGMLQHWGHCKNCISLLIPAGKYLKILRMLCFWMEGLVKNHSVTSFNARLSWWESNFPEVFRSTRRNIQKSVPRAGRQLLLPFLLR